MLSHRGLFTSLRTSHRASCDRLIYRLFLYRRHWGWNVGLIICCIVIQALCWNDPAGDAINRIRYNFMGNMMPFGMGLLLARWQQPIANSQWPMALLLSLAAIIALSFNFWTWLIVPLFVVIAHIGFIKTLSSIPAADVLVRGLAWVGGISTAIFVCHPITRKIFIPISHSGHILDGLAIYIVTTIMLAMIFKKIIAALK